MGEQTEAFSWISTAMGYETYAGGNVSTALGHATSAIGNTSTAMGFQTQAESANSTAVGSRNIGGGAPNAWIGTDPLFEIGNAQEFESRSNALTVLKNGRVGIGTHTPQNPLHIDQQSVTKGIRLDYISTSYWETYVDGPQDYNFAYNGFLKAYINDTDGSYIAVSDRSLKTDITPFPLVLEKVKQLKPCHYRFKDDMSGGNKSIGLIAQEVEPLFPEVVHEKDGIKAINYDAFAVIAIQAIKEQQEIIEELKTRIERLENK